MKSIMPLEVHMTGFPASGRTTNIIRDMVNYANLILWNSGVDREYGLRGIDARPWQLPRGYPADLPDVATFHLYLSPQPPEVKREWGAFYFHDMDGSGGCRMWLPQLYADGAEFCWQGSTFIHEGNHERGGAIDPTTETYELESARAEYLEVWQGWDSCLLHSPSHGPAWVPGLSKEEMARRNVLSPAEAEIWNRNCRGSRAPKPIHPNGGPWPMLAKDTPVPVIVWNGEIWSVFRAQAMVMGYPQRRVVQPPTLLPMLEVDGPPVPVDINRGRTVIVQRGSDFEVVAMGTVQGETYHLIGCYGDRDNPADWRYFGQHVAGPDGQVSFLVSNPQDPVCVFEVITVDGRG